jgi:hypothetical protein
MAGPPWEAILLPDGVWYAVDPGTVQEKYTGVGDGYGFVSSGTEYLVPASSVLAIRLPA